MQEGDGLRQPAVNGLCRGFRGAGIVTKNRCEERLGRRGGYLVARRREQAAARSRQPVANQLFLATGNRACLRSRSSMASSG